MIHLSPVRATPPHAVHVLSLFPWLYVVFTSGLMSQSDRPTLRLSFFLFCSEPSVVLSRSFLVKPVTGYWSQHPAAETSRVRNQESVPA